MDMHRNTKIGIGIAGGAAAVMASAIIGFAAGGALMASAADTVPVAAASASNAPEQGVAGHRRGANETPLTGSDAQKATAAAQAAVEGGTVIRVETDDQGTYEAHVRKTDGTEVVVKMDKDFNVTGVESFSGGRGGHRGHGPHNDGGAVPAPSSSAA